MAFRIVRSVAGAAVLSAAALVCMLGTSSGAQAQAAVPGRQSVVTINPLGIPFEYISAEIERRASDLVTLGLSGSFFGPGDVNYTTLEGKVRLYPNEEPLKGFSIGMAAGVTRLKENFFDSGSGNSSNTSTFPTLAVIIDYNWLLGKTKRVLVGTGVGAKRLFGSDDGFSDANFAYPTARFQVGVLF